MIFSFFYENVKRVSGKLGMLTCIVLAVSALSSCGGDGDEDSAGGGVAGGGEKPAVPVLKYRLATMDLNGKNRFSNAKYDEYGRITDYVGGWNYNYMFQYENNKITFSSKNDAEDRRSWVVQNGRIIRKGNMEYEYDAQGRVVKESHYPQNGGGWRDAIIHWEDGNISAIDIEYYSKDGVLSSTFYHYEYSYSQMECKSVLMYVKDRADAIHSPYSPLNGVDPILVAEGFFGNSSLKNLMVKSVSHSNLFAGSITSYTNYVNWEVNSNGLPVKASGSNNQIWTMSWE